MRGLPVDFAVSVEHLIAERFHGDKPAPHGAVDERTPAPPAMRIRVQNLIALDELAFGFEPLDDVLVAVLDKAPLVIGHVRREFAFGVNGTNSGNARALKRLVVILAKTRRRVHNARAVFHAHIVRAQHLERALCTGKIRKKRLVGGAQKFRALKTLYNLVVAGIFVIRSEPRFGENVVFAAVLDQRVGDVRPHREPQIGRQSPRRGCPCQKIGVGRQRKSGSRKRLKAHRDGGVVHVLVAAQIELVV